MKRSFASLVFFVASVGLACARGPQLDPGPIQIELVTGVKPADAAVRVTGLSSAELQALANARLEDTAWTSILRVDVADTNVAPVSGLYRVTEQSVEFQPRYPFDPGRGYSVRFDPARMPAPRPDLPTIARVRIAAPERSPATTVTAVYPSGDVWPENMLRFYIHFSAPMSRGAGIRHIHLLDARGEPVPDAILAAYGDLWNDTATRLTVFFDPGRVKRGVGPNVAMGRALVQGRQYMIAVDADWRDANGQPLLAPFRRPFTAGPAAYGALSTGAWRIAAPRASSRDGLTVTFPAPLDRALLDRAIGVRAANGRPVAGHAGVEAGETAWTFVPDAPWTPGGYALAVLALLEDPAGNSLERAFEVLTDSLPARQPPPELVTIPFDVK